MERSTDSPYVWCANRLADVLAAIQAMGSYKYYKLPFDQRADRISGDSSAADRWRTVFEEHPEFFRLDSEADEGVPHLAPGADRGQSWHSRCK